MHNSLESFFYFLGYLTKNGQIIRPDVRVNDILNPQAMFSQLYSSFFRHALIPFDISSKYQLIYYLTTAQKGLLNERRVLGEQVGVASWHSYGSVESLRDRHGMYIAV